MLDELFLSQPTATVLLSIAIMILAGYLLSRVTRLLKLPDVTAYIVVGVVIGPYVLNIIPLGVTSGMGFITDLTLGLIAFGVGKYFKFEKSAIKKSKVIIITLCETVITMLLVVLSMYFIFNFSLAFSFLLGAIACATAPASTVMTIRQYKAKGGFINTLLKVIAIDDAIAILIFHVCLVFVQTGTPTAWDVIIPIAFNIGLLGLGVGIGWVLKVITSKLKSKESKLMLTLVTLVSLIALCSILNIFPLLPCMAVGASFVNFKGDQETFDVVDRFLPPLFLLFFVYSGMSLDVSKLATIGLIGLAYFAIRILGKSVGAYMGGSVTKSSPRVKKYIGLALIPQASVSIGLAALACRVIPSDLGGTLSVIILSSAVLYELIGPVTAKLAIFASQSVPGHKKVITTTAENLDEIDSVVDNTLYVSAIEMIDKVESPDKDNKSDKITTDAEKLFIPAKPKQAKVVSKEKSVNQKPVKPKATAKIETPKNKNQD